MGTVSTSGGRSVRSRVSAAALVGAAIGVSTLLVVTTAPSPSPTAHPMVQRPAATHDAGEARSALRTRAADGPWGASDLRAAYRIAAPEGPTSTIAVVDAFGYPTAEADMNHYRQRYGLPLCTTASGCFTIVNQRGETAPLPKPDRGWAGETAMDLQMVSAACPTCRLILVEASNTGRGLYVAQLAAVRAGATVVSNSWGSSEQRVPRRMATYVQHPGVTTLASSGDSGYAARAHLPASVPGVLAVGGTVLKRAPETARGWTETVWSHASSGCSRYFAKPTWQTDSGCHGHRTVADVSAVASSLLIYNTSQPRGRRGWSVEGGTSASTPFVAGMIAAAGGGGLTPAQIYAEPTAFNDVTTGSNGTCRTALLCTGLVGYDAPTGLGSPISPEVFSSALLAPLGP